MKLSIFNNKRTSHPEILIKVYKQLDVRLQNDIIPLLPRAVPARTIVLLGS